VKIKKKYCDGCESSQFIWKNDNGSKYCKSCWYKAKVPSAKPLKRRQLNPKSKKMQIIDGAYTKLRKSFMEKKPMCEASLPGCNKISTDVHHKKGRGKYHLVVDTWLSVCRSCHTWIEEHPKEAIELGYSIKRN
tara:strand:- start:741 stop:1142 length:402 start_codon:yes stop_codon:yes gene_type:complete